MEMRFSADAMIKRVKAEGREDMLDGEVMELIRKLDGKVGNDYNWNSFVYGDDVVWIPEDDDCEGAYVARCDCEYV